MIEKKNRKKKVMITGVLLIIAALGVYGGDKAYINYKCNHMMDASRQLMTADAKKITLAANDNKNYATETIYDGADVPPELFELPFNDTVESGDTSYRRFSNKTNKEVMEKLSKKQVKKYIQTAENYLNVLLGNNYNTILHGQNAFMEQVVSLYGDNYDVTFDEQDTTVRALANDCLTWYIDNKMILDTEVKTDVSLFYQNNFNYVLRMAAYITPYSDKDSAIPSYFNLDLKNEKTVQVICNVRFDLGDPEHVNSIDFLCQE